jgi:glycerol-3-phosphate dehydrogenase (NAD(P)+)
VASENEKLSEAVAQKLRGPFVKVSCTTDIYGTEYAAVLKNIYAIAAGMAHGVGYGDNFQAVLVSNALREMKRVIRAVHPIKRQIIQTEYSGDLFVTMYSPFSRNRQLGNLIGKGYSLSAARSEMKMVAEGYYAAKLIREVKREREVKMPIASAVYKILYENASPKKTLRALAEKLK